jgi:hypothetical protein
VAQLGDFSARLPELFRELINKLIGRSGGRPGMRGAGWHC